MWFGVGWVTTLFIMLNTIFWLVFFNAMMGVRGVSRVYEHGVLTLEQCEELAKSAAAIHSAMS